MKVVYGLENLEPLQRCVLTVGNFDGVHLAHQELLRATVQLAGELAAPAVALTFEPHPLTVVAPDRAPPRLATPEDKLGYLQQARAELVVVAHSEPALLSLEAEQFITQVLVEKFRPVRMVEGPSFGFGRGRRGDTELLRREMARFGCAVEVVEPVHVRLDDPGEKVMVSSSLIRRLLSAGRVQEAAKCLGRPYALVGDVERGHGRGKALGYPTANLRVHDLLVPGEGVYAGWAEVLGQRHAAAISIGRAPTFGDAEVCTEAFLLDFDGDLYGRRLRLGFTRFLRPQQKFVSAAALADQLRLDVEAVRSELADCSPLGPHP